MGWVANFGLQFGAEVMSFGSQSGRSVQKAMESQGTFSADPSQISVGQVAKDCGWAAFNVAALVGPAILKGVSESYLKEVINPNTKISEIMNKQLPGTKRVWTKGLIIEPAAKKASRYQIKEIQGATYMFYEWKSGDYVLRQMKPSYYVLRKK